MEDEVIITSDNIFSIFNANGGTPIATYEKANNVSKKTLAVIKDSVFIGAKENKPIVEAWKICKEPDKMECGRQTCSGIVSCIIIDKSSCLGVVSFEGDIFKLYIWNIESGIFVIVEKQFFNVVTSLAFHSNDSSFTTGGKDGYVMNWILSDLLDAGIANETEKDPNWIWRHHSAEVTGIASVRDVIATVSLDETCQLLCSASGSIYRTINVKRPLTAVTIVDDSLFLGDENGFLNVYQTSDGVVDLEERLLVKIHNSQIFSLSLSADFSKLITASEEGFKIISCAKRGFKCLMSIAAQGKLTNAFFASKPRVFTTDLDSAPMNIHLFGITKTRETCEKLPILKWLKVK